jgi:protein-disulfide isomerase
MNTKTIIVSIGAFVVLLGGIFALVRHERGAQVVREARETQEIFALREDDHVRGAETDPVITLTVYSDFQCPACAIATKNLANVEEMYGDKVAVVYRHFPLTSIHRHAEMAARAAEAAARQGKFWPMHDKLFATQSAWSSVPDVQEIFMTYAQDLDLDQDRFAADMKDSDVRNRVARDALDARGLGLRGTPSVFLNGEEISLPSTPQGVDDMVEQALVFFESQQ